MFDSLKDQLYVFSIRKTVVNGWGRVVHDGKPAPLTMRSFVDHEIGRMIDLPAHFERVKAIELLDDYREDGRSRYIRLLGWDYSKACILAERDGAIFLMHSDPRLQSRIYEYATARDDDEYAFRMVQDFYGLSGGNICYEIFDPEKHVADQLMSAT